ncbi:hypothetical protein JL722_13748 [Aureococcus anophagefferens]|nr:hypothetical protein JL722_13748 [Aureococcus anophagefferens]
MNLMLLSLCMYRAAPDETDARRLALHVQRSHTAPHVHPRRGADAAAAESSAAPAFLGPAIDASPTAAAARPINVSNSSGEAAFRRWWADGRHLSSADAFEHATIADAGAKYAAVLFGMVRTWSMSRKMFQRTFLGPNGPMDLFFEVYAQDEAEVDLVASTILRLPRRRVHVERWGAPIMERLRTDHRVTVELGWRMLEAHVAAGRGGVDYDAVLLARTDLSYPPQPFDMARAAAADALLIPVGADMPFNDQLAVGRPRWLRAYATAYSHCASSGAARALYGKAVPIGDHFCGKLERSLVPAIRSRVPDDKFRRFWFQYWIVRGYQIPYFEEHHDFAYRTWGSPCCWQRLNWAQPAMSLSVLVDLNTTCLVDPNVLGKHDKNSVRWPQGGSVDLLKCRFAGSYCDFKKYPSSCKDAKGRRRARTTTSRGAPPPRARRRPARSRPLAHGVRGPPGGGNATVVRFGAVDESGLRVAGRGWGRVLAKWRCAKQMKIAVLGGSMTCGGNLAKRHNDKTKAWPARLLAKLRSSLGAGVALHNACEPASSLGCSRERREPPPAVLFLTTILPPKFHQPTTAPALKGWRALWADPARAAAYGAVLQGHARIYDRVARFHGASSFALQDHDGLWPAGEFLGNARLDRLWRAPAAKGGDVDHHPGVPAHEFVADAAHAAVLALVRRAERGDGAVVPDWAPAGGTLASANELAGSPPALWAWRAPRRRRR